MDRKNNESTDKAPVEKKNQKNAKKNVKKNEIKKENNVEQVKPVEPVTPVETEPVKPVETAPAPTAPVEKPKKSGVKVLPIILCFIALVVIVLAVVARTVMTSPKFVFSNVIDDTYKEVSKELKIMDDLYDPNKEALVVNGSVSLDSNMDLEELLGLDIDEKIDISDIELNGSFGLDIPNEEALLTLGVKGKEETIDAKLFFTDAKMFLETSFYDKVVKFSDDYDLNLKDVQDALKENDVDFSLYDDILSAFVKSLSKSLDKDAMSKEKDEIDVLDKEIKVTKNTYKINEKTMQRLVKNLAENLLDNKDFIKKLSKATGIEESDIKDELKEMKKSASDISLEETIYLNVYTRGALNKFAGIDLVVDKETVVSYYKNGDNVEAMMNDGEKVKLTIEDGKKERKAKVTVGGEKVATATIRALEEDKIDLDYEIYQGDEEMKGTIYLTRKNSKKSITGDYKFKVEYDDEYITLSGSYGIEAKKELDGVKTSGAIDEDDVDEEAFEEALMDAVKKDDTLSTIVDAIIESVEREEIESKLNYYDMIDVKSTEAIDLLSKNKATVLYVGFSYYSASDPYYMFKRLRDAQDELGFYSYMLNETSVNEEFKNAVANIEFECTQEYATEGETCQEWPAIILIKNGKPVKGYRGTVKYDKLIEDLEELGL